MKVKLIVLAALLFLAACASQNASNNEAARSKAEAGAAYQELDQEVGKDTLK